MPCVWTRRTSVAVRSFDRTERVWERLVVDLDARRGDDGETVDQAVDVATARRVASGEGRRRVEVLGELVHRRSLRLEPDVADEGEQTPATVRGHELVQVARSSVGKGDDLTRR